MDPFIRRPDLPCEAISPAVLGSLLRRPGNSKSAALSQSGLVACGMGVYWAMARSRDLSPQAQSSTLNIKCCRHLSGTTSHLTIICAGDCHITANILRFPTPIDIANRCLNILSWHSLCKSMLPGSRVYPIVTGGLSEHSNWRRELDLRVSEPSESSVHVADPTPIVHQ